jgi:hypothetical protein
MPVTVTDRRVNCGLTRDGTPWIKNECVLGTPQVAEAIIEWSQARMAGTSKAKTTIWGLTLECVARGDEPNVILKLNEKRLREFLAQFGPMTIFSITEWGVTLVGPMNKTEEPVTGKDAEATIFFGAEEIVLHEFKGGTEESLCLGTLVLSNEGFKFYNLTELMSTIEKKAEVEHEDDEEEEDIILCNMAGE